MIQREQGSVPEAMCRVPRFLRVFPGFSRTRARVDWVILRCPRQALTLTETVFAYTAGAAYAIGEEKIKGTISPGNLADLAVLSQDIIAIDPIGNPRDRSVSHSV